ncbi:hypothetical protein JN11_01870 [Mucilaginibacter frigoritolerans]|uniref:YD repeat-containing protein n=1 Tax=Mucilaginibacter frigoritolerans TaxID=652788 RepID=A0A562U7B2_9SPHI|nr:hypothetical protein [Mucilaginibacter frigoritolerans]TWJ01716.1 hypothetical protein JN11_01870 [Mucilaginibacter frigoritolerans]
MELYIHKRYIYLLFLIPFFTILVDKSFAQNTTDANANYIEFDIKKTVPTSPEAAMLGRFGDIPIGYYTGTANISVPLYTIKEGDLTIPINLSYHGSGIKVEDEATWVGLGWSMEPEGAIIKIINGKDDNITADNLPFIDATGYQYLFSRNDTTTVPGTIYSQTMEVGTSMWVCDGSGTVFSGPNDSAPILGAIIAGQGQPDIYQYSLPGGTSGKFYINPKTGLPVLIDKKDSLVVETPASTNQGGWIIKTLNGDKYLFASQETSYTDNFTNYGGETWKLTQITLSNGKIINFSYAVGGYSSISYNETYHDPYSYQPIAINDYGVVKHFAFPENTTQILTQIKTDNVTVNFNLGSRQDISSGGNPGGPQYSQKQVNSVDIVSTVTGQTIKSFDFNYSYFNSSADTSYTYLNYSSTSASLPVTSTARLKLDSVKEVGYTSAGLPVYNPPYVFTYNTSVAFPSKASFSRDFWGYYNGVINNKLLPNLNYFYYSNFNNYKSVPPATLNAFVGANRTVDTNFMKVGILTSVKYPTGGYTTFKYQANDFSNYSYPDVNAITNNSTTIRVSDQNNSTDVKSATFTLATNQTVQFNNYVEGGPTPTAPSFSAIQPSTITLSSTVNGVTSIVKQWTVTTNANEQAYDAGNDVISWLNDPVNLVANTPYTISVELPDALGPQNTASAQAVVLSTFSYYSPATNAPQLSYGGGLRVSTITDYDNTGALINNKVLKYINTDGTSSGKLMSNLNFLYARNILSSLQTGDLQTGDGSSFQAFAALQTVWYVSSQSAIPYSNSAGGNPVGYSRVEEINTGPNNTTNGKHVYYYFNTPDQTKVNNPNVPDLRNGLVAEEDILKANGDTLKKITSFYSDNNLLINPKGNSFTGVKIFNNFIGPDPCYKFEEPINGEYNYDPTTMPNKYEIDFYPIKSSWNLLNSKQTKDYNSNGIITTTEGYVYNNIGQLVRDSITNSRGEILTTYNKFPNDADTINNLTNKQLVDSSFYDHILEQHKLNNEVETSQVKINYAIINNQLVRSELDRSYNGNPLFTDVIFNQYGPNKNIQQVSDRGMKPSSIIWDYTNTYVIAEVNNANIVDIAYSSFEPNQSGNWLIDPSAKANPVGITGSYSCTLAGGTISKSGLTASKTYVVSYWTNTGTPLTIAGTVSGYPKMGLTLNGWTYYEYLVTGQTTITLSGGGTIDELRLYPLGTEMTSYTYNPPIGITSMINAKSQINYYEYDSFLRLMNIKDQYGNIIKHTDYHYQGQ